MSERPAERLKPVANRAAELLSSEDGAAVLALFQQLRVLAPVADPSPSQDAGSSTVGIWEPRQERGQTHYFRVLGNEPWHLWADVEHIPPKGRAKRIVLLGESVARGYFLDPYFNPAMALGSILSAAAGPDRAEVIDLARTDQNFDGLLRLAERALAFQPDVFVFFCGNNVLDLFDLTNFLPIAARTLLRGGSFADVRREAEARVRTNTVEIVRRMAALSDASGVPVLLMIPEFNLVDWRSALERPAPFLDRGDNAQWLSLWSEAKQALAGHDRPRAAALGAKLVELDGGVTEAGWDILARGLLHSADQVNLRGLLERARDAEIWSAPGLTPRCFSVVQETMRAQAPQRGMHVVDLTRRLEEYSGTLPDRRMFYDYCHLSVEGIRVAMASAAQSLLPMLQAPDWPLADLIARCPHPSPEVAAEAHFLAAIHNGNWGQGSTIITWHCQRALQLSPRIADAMECYLDFWSRSIPNIFCASLSRLYEVGALSSGRFLGPLGFGPDGLRLTLKGLRLTLMDAMISALQEAGVDAAERLEAVRCEQHGIIRRDIDLLDRAYWADSYARLRPERAYTGQSHFAFVSEEPTCVELALTYRTVPGASADGRATVEVQVNGTTVGALPPAGRWATERMCVPRAVIRRGVNRIVIGWPIPPDLGRETVKEFARELELGDMTDPFPLLGEIHRFTASARTVV